MSAPPGASASARPVCGLHCVTVHRGPLGVENSDSKTRKSTFTVCLIWLIFNLLVLQDAHYKLPFFAESSER